MNTTQKPGYETRDVSLKHLFSIGIVALLVLILILVGIREYFVFSTEKQVYDVVLQPPSPKLIELRAHEQEILSTYGQADEEGYYRIPIQQAKEILLQEALRTNKGD